MRDLKPLPKPVDLQKLDRFPKVREVAPKMLKKPYWKASEQAPIREKPAVSSSSQSYQQSRHNRKKKGTRHCLLRKKAGRILKLLLILAFILPLIFFLWPGNNALAIYLGDSHLGYIAFSGDIDEAILTTEVINRVELRENAQITALEQITLRPANSLQRNILPYNEAIERLMTYFKFQIMGVSVEVNGIQVAILRNQSEADELIWNLQSPFLLFDSERYHIVEFVEDFVLTNIAVDEESFSTIGHALDLLNREILIVEEYIVQAGDTLGDIALRNNTTVTQLHQNNLNFTDTAVLQVGDILRIHSYRPYLSVRTVFADTRIETIPIENQYLENFGEVNTFYQTIQQGFEGHQEVVVHVTRINGIQIEPEQIMATEIIQAMIPSIIEIGVLEHAEVT